MHKGISYVPAFEFEFASALLERVHTSLRPFINTTTIMTASSLDEQNGRSSAVDAPQQHFEMPKQDAGSPRHEVDFKHQKNEVQAVKANTETLLPPESPRQERRSSTKAEPQKPEGGNGKPQPKISTSGATSKKPSNINSDNIDLSIQPLLGSFYSDKKDAQVGRLLETIEEREQWIRENQPWTEIPSENIYFENLDSKVNVQIVIPEVEAVRPISDQQIVVWFSERSMEVRIEGRRSKNATAAAEGQPQAEERQATGSGAATSSTSKNYVFLCRELWGHIDPGKSSWKLRNGKKLKIVLIKGQTGRSMDKWEKLRRL
ncbi:unnamed protein product [Amoebophrya sp. A120]|nr:unnamed protein product [Amoebophrya sp. A120]|eukprot:GSA120T00008894001.1